MAIVDLSLNSDSLAARISVFAKKVAARIDAVPAEPIYLIGSADDFDEFSVPLMRCLDIQEAGCIDSVVTHNLALPTSAMRFCSDNLGKSANYCNCTTYSLCSGSC